MWAGRRQDIDTEALRPAPYLHRMLLELSVPGVLQTAAREEGTQMCSLHRHLPPLPTAPPLQDFHHKPPQKRASVVVNVGECCSGMLQARAGTTDTKRCE